MNQDHQTATDLAARAPAEPSHPDSLTFDSVALATIEGTLVGNMLMDAVLPPAASELLGAADLAGAPGANAPPLPPHEAPPSASSNSHAGWLVHATYQVSPVWSHESSPPCAHVDSACCQGGTADADIAHGNVHLDGASQGAGLA